MATRQLKASAIKSIFTMTSFIIQLPFCPLSYRGTFFSESFEEILVSEVLAVGNRSKKIKAVNAEHTSPIIRILPMISFTVGPPND